MPNRTVQHTTSKPKVQRPQQEDTDLALLKTRITLDPYEPLYPDGDARRCYRPSLANRLDRAAVMLNAAASVLSEDPTHEETTAVLLIESALPLLKEVRQLVETPPA
jgi:hypothetical protein